MKPLRVLFVVGSMEIGGVQSGIMNFVKITPPDQVHFDIVVLTEKKGYHEAEFQKYGHVYHISLPHTSNKYISIPYTLLNDLLFRHKFKQFLKSHESYDVVHTKLLKGTAPAMEAAKACGFTHTNILVRNGAGLIWKEVALDE